MSSGWKLWAPKLFDGLRWHDSAQLRIHGHQLQSLTNVGDVDPGRPDPGRPDPGRPDPAESDLVLDRGILVPGLVDLQVNGGGGVLLNNQPDAEGLRRLAAAHLAHGTTCLLPTLLSDHGDIIDAAVGAARQLRGADAVSPVAGLHVEGPWFAPARRGTHAGDRIHRPAAEEIGQLCAQADQVRLVTLAPEVMQAGQIRQLCAAGIRVLAGHSDATATQLAAAREEGLSGFTHLYNAMRPPTAREPGVVGTALASDWASASLIADGHHVDPQMIRLALHCLGPARLYLVSDAMATAGSEHGSFSLYGETLEVRDGQLINREGRLAGSTIVLLDALRHAHQVVGLPLEDCLRMCSSTPAAQIPDLPIGHIAPGMRADLLWLGDDLELLGVWQAGRRQPLPDSSGIQQQ